VPATGAIISFCLAETRSATAGPDGGVYDKYGDSACAAEEPVETFFDSMGDVQDIAEARLDLLKADRRKFNAEVRGESAVLGLCTGNADSDLRRIIRLHLTSQLTNGMIFGEQVNH